MFDYQQSVPPAHIVRVLERLKNPQQTDYGCWRAVCPICNGVLEVRDIDWQGTNRRVRLWCRRDDERALLRHLKMREDVLYLKDRDRQCVPNRANVEKLISQCAFALGLPVATPEWVRVDGNPQLSPYRVWRFWCPACGGGQDDPTYRPLFIDSEANIGCDECHSSTERIIEEVRNRRNYMRILNSIGDGQDARSSVT